MTLTELIEIFPEKNSIPERVLLLSPGMLRQMQGRSIHECRVFILVTQGTLTLRAGGHVTHVEADYFIDMLVWEPIEFVSQSEDLKAWCLLPNYLFTKESLSGLKPADLGAFKNRLAIPMLRLEAAETSAMERQCGLLLEALCDVENYYRTELCRTYFRSYMLVAGNIIQRKNTRMSESGSVENRQDAILRSFLKLVWRYYMGEHNVDFYAERLCLSSKHLSRVVRDKLGKTPYAVIRDELLMQASSLLKDSTLSVSEISSELHFSEPAAFCKFFRKHYGLCPTKYRARQLSSKDSCGQ